jgi:hypothetical protein
VPQIIAASSLVGGYACSGSSSEVRGEPGGVSIVAAVRRRSYSPHQPLRSAVFGVKSVCPCFLIVCLLALSSGVPAAEDPSCKGYGGVGERTRREARCPLPVTSSGGRDATATREWRQSCSCSPVGRVRVRAWMHTDVDVATWSDCGSAARAAVMVRAGNGLQET